MFWLGSMRQKSQTLKISRQAVYQWGEYVPEAAAFKLLEQEPTLPVKRVS
jgi:hypothetical protein